MRENLSHFESFGFFHEPIEVDETTVQLPSQIAPDRALSDRHEPNEGNVLNWRFRQLTSSF
jgi:hypothetical protein